MLKKYKQSQLTVKWFDAFMKENKEDKSKIKHHIKTEVIINDDMDVCVKISSEDLDLEEDTNAQIYLFMDWDDDFKIEDMFDNQNLPQQESIYLKNYLSLK